MEDKIHSKEVQHIKQVIIGKKVNKIDNNIDDCFYNICDIQNN